MEWMLTLGECLGPRFSSKAPALLDLYFENLHTPYAEVSKYISASGWVDLNTLQSKDPTVHNCHLSYDYGR